MLWTTCFYLTWYNMGESFLLHLKNMKSPTKVLLGVLIVTILLFGIEMIVYKSDNVISYHEQWITPFESIATTIYDLGDGYTSTVTTSTVTAIIRVKHTDQGMFSTAQWNEILSGIESGNIIWED